MRCSQITEQGITHVEINLQVACATKFPIAHLECYRHLVVLVEFFVETFSCMRFQGDVVCHADAYASCKRGISRCSGEAHAFSFCLVRTVMVFVDREFERRLRLSGDSRKFSVKGTVAVGSNSHSRGQKVSLIDLRLRSFDPEIASYTFQCNKPMRVALGNRCPFSFSA
jgi:hypothetical protein